MDPRIRAAFAAAAQARKHHTLLRSDTLELLSKRKELWLDAQAIARRHRQLCIAFESRQQPRGR